MATTLRFVLLGDDRAGQAFDRFAKSVDRANTSVARNEVALGKQSKASKDAQGGLFKLIGTVTGFGDAGTAASKKTSLLPKIIAGIGLATGPAEAAISALTVSTGSLVTGLTAAGVGLAAYGAAALPLMTQVQLLLHKQQLALNGTKAAQQAYQRQLAATPKPIRDFATALAATHKEYQNWATSLARPVLAPLYEGLKIVNPLLKAMRPFVREAAAALLDLTTQAVRAVKSSGFQQWLWNMRPLVYPVLTELGKALGNVVVGFGHITEAFAPFALGIFQGLDKLTGKFRSWSADLGQHSGFQAMISQWRNSWPAVKLAMGQALGIIVNIVKAWSSMVTGGNSKWLWNVANPLLALLKALSGNPALVQLFTYLYLIGRGAKQITGVFESIKSGWEGVTKFLSLVSGGKIQLGMQSAADTMVGASENMQRAADTMAGASAGGAAGGAEAGAAGAAGAASRTGSIIRGVGIAAAIAAVAGQIIGAISPQSGKSGLANYRRNVPGWLQGIGGAAFGGSQHAANLYAALPGPAPGQQGPLRSAWDALFGGGRAVTSTTVGGLPRSLAMPQQNAGFFAKTWSSAYEGFQRGFAGPLTHWFTVSLPQFFTRGIPSKWSWLYEAFQRDAAGPVTAWFTRLPSRVRGWLASAGRWLLAGGRNVVGGLWSGMQDTWSVVAHWWGGFRARMVGYFARAVGWLTSKGQDVVTGLWHGIRDVWNTVSRWFDGMSSRISGYFRGAVGWLAGSGRNVILGFMNGIRDKITGIASWINANVVQPVIHAVEHYFGIHSPSQVMFGLGSNVTLGLLHGIMSHNPLSVVRKVFGTLPQALVHLVEKGLVSLSSLPGRALHALSGLGGAIENLFGFGGGSGGVGVARWAGLVRQVLAMLGQPAGALGIVLSQMNTESGGNPRAINLSDINAQMGDPSRGLMQTIMSTFLAYAGPFARLGIYNPLANIYAGLNYAIHRYGARGWMSVLGHGHGYESGAWRVPKTGPALIHANEMILPAALAEAVRTALGAGASGDVVAAIKAMHADVARLLASGPAKTAGGVTNSLNRSARRAGYSGLYGTEG
jgi:hypothetical protein